MSQRTDGPFRWVRFSNVVLLKNALSFIRDLLLKIFAITTRTILTIFIIIKVKAAIIFLPQALPLIVLIVNPLFYFFMWIEFFITFYLLLRNRWYVGFIKEHSIFVYKILNFQVYMPHDFFLDIFFFVSYRLFTVSYAYHIKFFIFLLLTLPFTILVICFATILLFFFVISFYILFCRLWDNVFMLEDTRVLGRMVDWEEGTSKHFDPNIGIFLFIIGHNSAIIFWYHKIRFFGRRNIYYHNLPIWEKITIFWKMYFKVINRPANFFWFTLCIVYFSLYKTIVFTQWSRYPVKYFLKIFFYKLNYYLMEDFLYVTHYMISIYSLKHITVVHGKIIFI